jgi:hypothetical protein
VTRGTLSLIFGVKYVEVSTSFLDNTPDFFGFINTSSYVKYSTCESKVIGNMLIVNESIVTKKGIKEKY